MAGSGCDGGEKGEAEKNCDADCHPTPHHQPSLSLSLSLACEVWDSTSRGLGQRKKGEAEKKCDAGCPARTSNCRACQPCQQSSMPALAKARIQPTHTKG